MITLSKQDSIIVCF